MINEEEGGSTDLNAKFPKAEIWQGPKGRQGRREAKRIFPKRHMNS